MKFSISKDVLLKGLGKTQSVIEKKATLPILSNVLIEAKGDAIEIVATDLEVGIKGRYDADVKKEGSITVGAKKLFEIVRELPEDTVKINTTDNNWVHIKCGSANFKIVGLAADDFPILPLFDSKDFQLFPADVLAEMIEKVQHAISLDETRYYLNGLYLTTDEVDGKKLVRMVATDGHRLALMDREMPEKSTLDISSGYIIPRKGINELRKALAETEGDASICFKDRNLIVSCRNLLFIIRLIDEDFPEYNQVIPEGNDRSLVCSSAQLLGTIRRVSILSTEMGKGIKFACKKDSLTISCSNPDLGEAKEEIPVEYGGEEMEIGFNARYFLEVLNIIKEEDVQILLADALSPGLIKVPSDPGFLAVIMPMRI